MVCHALIVKPEYYYRGMIIFAMNAVHHGCQTCDNHPRLQKYCPDCRDRGFPTEQVDGRNRSGNVLWVRLQEERRKLETEEVTERERVYREAHLRECPACDKVGFIPDDDYICESCRTGD